jgi:hypothetical protein
MEYLVAHGKAGLHERTNGQTVAQVLAEYTGAQESEVSRSSEVGGMCIVLRGFPMPHNAGPGAKARGPRE